MMLHITFLVALKSIQKSHRTKDFPRRQNCGIKNIYIFTKLADVFQFHQKLFKSPDSCGEPVKKTETYFLIKRLGKERPVSARFINSSSQNFHSRIT